MASSRRTHRRREQRSFRRHQLRLEGLEKRYALNAAPVLDDAASPALLSIAEDASAPTGQVGTLVSSLIDTSGTHNNFSDADGDLPGIAITGVNLQGGTLWYSTDNGSTWLDVGNVSDSAARVLYADSESRLMFTPATNFNGTISDVLTFKAWGRTNEYANGEGNVVTTASVIGSYHAGTHSGAPVTMTLSPDEDTAYVSYGDHVDFIDISNPADPIEIGSGLIDSHSFGDWNDIVISANGETAYLTDADGFLDIYDISNPTNATEIGRFYNPPGTPQGVKLSNDENTAYLSVYLLYGHYPRTGLQIVDVSDKANPLLLGNHHAALPSDLEISTDESTAYILQTKYLDIVNISDPANMQKIGEFFGNIYGNYKELQLSSDGTIAYLLAEDVLQIINIHDPTNPTLISSLPASYFKNEGDAPTLASLTISSDEKIAYVAHNSWGNGGSYSFSAINITDPTNPFEVWEYDSEYFIRTLTLSSNGKEGYLLSPDHYPSQTGYLQILSFADDFSTLSDSVSIEIASRNDPPTGGVSVVGVAAVGEVISVDTSRLADGDGLGNLNYQWNRDGNPVDGATASTYTLAEADVGAVISVTVSYTDAENSFESVTSSLSSTVLGVNNSPVLDPSADLQLDSIVEDTDAPVGLVGTPVSSLINGPSDRLLEFPASVLPGTTIGNLPLSYETSGLAWHDGLQKLFAVSDDSIVSMMNADGTGRVNLGGYIGDLEALTVADHISSKIYIGVEHPDSIVEFDVNTGQVTRTFELTSWMTGANAKGLSALAFVPDATHPEGGIFYAGLQETGRIYQFSLPIATSSSSTAVNFIQSISIEGGSTDLEGLAYESSSGQLLAMFDSTDQLKVIDRYGQLRSRWTVPGAGQEAVVFIDGHLYIGDDTLGSITRYSGFDALIDTGGTNNFSDADGDLPGIAITGVNLQGGTLWYSTDNGSTWLDVGNVSDSAARVLYADSESRLMFTPATNFNGTISDVLTFKAWGRTNAYANGEGNVVTTASVIDFSTLSDIVSIEIASRDDAPDLDPTASPQLDSVLEDAGAPVGQVGTLVSSLIDNGGTHDNFNDVDGDLPGIAITAVNLQGGTLWYSTDNGSTWLNVGAVSDTLPCLLAADATTRLYFEPAANFSETISDVITFKSWDRNSLWQLGLNINGEAAGDLFGSSVAVSADGSMIAVGAPYSDNNANNSGHVRIYSWDGSAWQQMGSDIDGEVVNDRSGSTVSLSNDGKSIAIGTPFSDHNTNNSGHVRIYSWNGSAWNQVGADIDGEAEMDRSGQAVSLSSDGQTVAIGAPYSDDNANDSGHVRIYSWNGSAWNQVGADIDGEAEMDRSGQAVSLSSDGQTVAIGARWNDGNGLNSGHVRIYSWNGTAWNQVGTDIYGEHQTHSGQAVSLSADGQTVAIGARLNDGNGLNSGHVRIYSWNGSAWNQVGTDIDGEASEDESGSSISLSADGQTVAIGARLNDGNGLNSGHVRIYSWNGSAWNKVGTDIDGEASEDESGSSIALSANGQTIVIGASQNDGNDDDAGHARVYRFSSLSTITDTISIDVEPLNDEPTLNDLSVSTYEEVDVDISLAGTDIDSTTLTYTVTGKPTAGSVSVVSGIATYTPNIHFFGTDSFVITVSDNHPTNPLTDTATVTVTVANQNDAPTLDAIADISILEGVTEQTVLLSGITAGPNESQKLRVTAISSNAGLLADPVVTYTSADSTGSLAFTPVADQHGAATITVTVEDGGLDNDLATVGDNATFSQSFDVTVSAANNFSTPILDQSNTSSEDPAFNGHSNGTRGQTFTAGVAGMLSSIDSLINGLVTLRLHTTNEQGLPENLLGEFVTDTGDTSEFVLHKFDVSSLQYYVTPGDRLAITFIASHEMGLYGRIAWTRSSYDRGSYIHLEPDGWTAYEDLDTSFGNQHPTSDLAFRTWVSPLEPDHNIVLSNSSIPEGNVPDSLIGFLSSENPNGSDEYTFRLVGGSGDNHNAMFQISGNQLFIEQSVDYESTSELSVRIRSTNTGGSYVEDTFTVYVDDVNEVPTIDDLTDMLLTENALAQTVVLAGISAGPNESQLLRITASSDNPNLIPSPIVSYTSPNVFGSLVFTPNQDVFGETQITVTVEDAGLDGDLGTSEDNLVVNKVFDVEVFELLPSVGSHALARNSLGQLHVGTQQVLLDDQPVLPNIHGFRALGAEEIGIGNSLLVARNNILGNETRYRLVTDESWRINGLFHSLHNESSLPLNPSARELSNTFNISAVSGAYVINGVNNPTLTVRRGQTYIFNLNTGVHRLWLQTTGGGYQSANVYDSEFTGNSQTTSEHQWVVPADAPDELFYQCEFHPVMFGKIIVVD